MCLSVSERTEISDDFTDESIASFARFLAIRLFSHSIFSDINAPHKSIRGVIITIAVQHWLLHQCRPQVEAGVSLYHFVQTAWCMRRGFAPNGRAPAGKRWSLEHRHQVAAARKAFAAQDADRQLIGP